MTWIFSGSELSLRWWGTGSYYFSRVRDWRRPGGLVAWLWRTMARTSHSAKGASRQEIRYNVGIMLGTDGFLAEGSIESVFIVKDGVLKTPPRGRVLSSITRMSILQAVPKIGIAAEEHPISADELNAADEIFTAHTGIKVSPINRFENRQLQAPGPVTKQVMEWQPFFISRTTVSRIGFSR